MASFEPFVGTDPFDMKTFNSKIGGAFNKVDGDVANATTTASQAIDKTLKRTVLLLNKNLSTTPVNFTEQMPENTKFVTVGDYTGTCNFFFDLSIPVNNNEYFGSAWTTPSNIGGNTVFLSYHC